MTKAAAAKAQAAKGQAVQDKPANAETADAGPADSGTAKKRAAPRKAPAKKRSRVKKPARPGFATWSKKFLSHLANSSNVTASAEEAGVSTTTAYDAKRAKPEFNRLWRQALCEGYEHLEMELLHRFRCGEGKPDGRDDKPVRKFDNATAFRLLTAHRDEAAQQRAIRDDDDAEAILASIDAKLDRMRARQLESDDDDDGTIAGGGE